MFIHYLSQDKCDKQSTVFCLKAKLVCRRGLCIGSSAITTLGDPAKGKKKEFLLLQNEVGYSLFHKIPTLKASFINDK